MPGNFSRVRLYADRRWKVYSNNKTERMQALPPPLGSPAAGLLGLQKGRYPNEGVFLKALPASHSSFQVPACPPSVLRGKLCAQLT